MSLLDAAIFVVGVIVIGTFCVHRLEIRKAREAAATWLEEHATLGEPEITRLAKR